MAGIGRAGSLDQTRRRLFVLRRACWFGRVGIKDIQEAFGVTRQIAGKDLADAVDHWTWIDTGGKAQPVLSRGTRAVQPIYPVPFRHLDIANAAMMMKLLSSRADFPDTGLRHSEVGLIFPGTERSKIDPQIIEVLLQSVLDRQSQGLAPRIVVVRYVGVKRDDLYRFRKILPVALEFDGAQIRVHAQDMAAEGWPLKVFVLSRIDQAKFSDEPLPKGFVRRDVSRLKKIRLKLTLDPRLTADQKSAIAREIAMNESGVVEVEAGYAHSFRRFYTNGVPPNLGPDIVWPPVIFTEELP
ncbi:MAG: hypothetical protein HYZ17_06195 [Betaproteobacteria bacterium]|nr:hypothetical protein [Betaproteobacteria bacterium]